MNADSKEYKPDTHNGTTTGYLVEARCTAGPKAIGKQIFTDEWQQVQFDDESHGGIPAKAQHPEFQLMHAYTYDGAQALRYWFLSSLGYHWGIETRLMKYRIEYRCEKHQLGPSHEEKDAP